MRHRADGSQVSCSRCPRYRSTMLSVIFGDMLGGALASAVAFAIVSWPWGNVSDVVDASKVTE